MDPEELRYSNDTLISPFTSKPVTEKVKTKPIIFWCALCCKKMGNPPSARKHMATKGHLDRLYAQVNELETKTNNVQQPVVKTDEPINKKPRLVADKPRVANQPKVAEKPKVGAKVAEKPKIKCEDCKLEFDNEHNALHHFKGKRHAKVFAAKIAAKQKHPTVKQRGGYGGRGGSGISKGIGISKIRASWIGSRSTGRMGMSGGRLQTTTTGGMGMSGGRLQTTTTWRNRGFDALQNYGRGQGNNQLSRPQNFGVSNTDFNRYDDFSNYGNNNNNIPKTNVYGNDYYSNNNNQNFSVDNLQTRYNSSRSIQSNYSYAGELKNNLTSEIFRLKRRLNEI